LTLWRKQRSHLRRSLGIIGPAAVLVALLVAGVPLLPAQASAPAQKGRRTPLELLQTAHALFLQKDYEGAREYYLEILPSYPRNFEILKNLAFCFFKRGPRGYAQAASYYSRAYEVNPSSTEVAEDLAKCLLGVNRAAEAAAIYQKMAQQPGAPALAWKRTAEAYDAADRIQQAEAAYDAYLQRSPGDLDARTKLGSLFVREKNYARAQEQYRMVLSSNPNYPPALIGMARMAAWQGQHEEALRLYDRVLRLDPSNGEAEVGKAFVLLWSDRYEDAQALFQKLRQRHPRDTEIARGLEQAEAALRQRELTGARRSGDTARVEAFYRERLARNPSDIAALKALAEASATPARCSESVEFSRKGLELAPTDASLELRLARSLVLCQQYAEAIAHYQRVLAADPTAEGALSELGSTLLRARRNAEAIEVFRKVLQSNPQHADANLGLALALAANHNYEEALQRYDRVLKSSPDNYDALQGKAYVLLWTGQVAQARAIFQSLAAKRPSDTQNADALDSISRAEEDAKWVALRPPSGAPPQDLLAYCEKRLAAYPDDLQALKGRASAQAQLNDLPAAIQSYQQVLEKYPDDRTSKMELARLSGRQGQYDVSIKYYREVLKDSPDDSETLEGLARVYVWAKQDREALPIYQGLLARDPANNAYRLELARIQARLQDQAAARETFTSVLAADPQNREALLALARLDLGRGDRPSALNRYEEVLKQAPNDSTALLGKAQIAYYHGDMPLAYATTSQVLATEPENFDAVFLLANIEHARRNRRKSLDLLDRAAKLSPGNTEVLAMQQRIREESAVTLTTSASYAREIGPASEFTAGGIGFLPERTIGGLANEDVRFETYSSTLGVPLIPRVDSYFSFTSLPTQSPPLPTRDAQGNQISTPITGAVAPWIFVSRHVWRPSRFLTIRGGAGVARFGPPEVDRLPRLTGDLATISANYGSALSALGINPERTETFEFKPVGMAGVTIAPSKKFSIDLDWTRSPAVYFPTPYAMKRRLSQTRFSGGLNFSPTPRTDLNFDFFYARLFTDAELTYSLDNAQLDVQPLNVPCPAATPTEIARGDTTHTCLGGNLITQRAVLHDWGHGGAITFNQNLVHSERFSLDGGYRGIAYGYAGRQRQVFLGFFNPPFYQNHMVTGRIYGKLFGPVGYDWHGAFGLQQTNHGGPLTRSSTISPSFSFKVSPHLTLGIGYTHYNSAQVLGPLRGNAVRFTTDWKF